MHWSSWKFDIQFGLYQVIKETAYILDTSYFFFDFFDKSKPKLIMASRIHSSLYPSYDDQIFSSKNNLEIIYHPPYMQKVCHYKDANTKLNGWEFHEFNWQSIFLNTSVNEKCWHFSTTIRKSFGYIMSHELN